PLHREKREQGGEAPGVPLSRGGGWGGRERGRGEGLGRGNLPDHVKLAPLPDHPLPGRGVPGWSVLAVLPLLPVRGVARGREKRAGVMRVLGGGNL
ncbi:MAG TPA: hypothetical protein VGS07_04920, partial [Thermoanaerobaculia bacterium]|nr:hypothetical protein [Thermoanaerobaculia bacterium]